MQLSQDERRLHQAHEDAREAAETRGYTNTHHPKACLCALCLSGGEPERCAYCQCVEVAERGDYCSEGCRAAAVEDDNADRALNAERENGG